MSGWLIDKSAHTRLARSLDPELWANRIERGLVRITSATRLEMGFSARSAGDLRSEITSPPLARMPVVYLTPAIEDRAMEVQLLLAERGHHRAVSVPDLLIAATAELTGLTVLHRDKDFDLVAEITGQPIERIELAPGT
jgi:predicted nucleic acid-binding protein